MPELKPLSEMLAGREVEVVELLATDMDGTLTQSGQFRPELLVALRALELRGLPVVIVTGRSAGWVSGLAQYLPVAGAICENGGAFFRGELREWLVPIVDVRQMEHLPQWVTQAEEGAGFCELVGVLLGE